MRPKNVHSNHRNACAMLALLALALPLAAQAGDVLFKSGFELSYYVSASSGNDSNPGTLAQPWKTINRAVRSNSEVSAGSTIYVQAGTYSEQVKIKKDLIDLVGYKSTPGDEPPVLVDQPIDPETLGSGYPFDPDDMPLLDGGNRSTGTGIDVHGRRKVTIRNFSIRRYENGILAGTDDLDFVEGHVFDNINLSTFGDTSDEYSGVGMYLGLVNPLTYSNGNTLSNILVVNAAAEGIKVYGVGNEVYNVRVYGADPNGNASTDYYVVVGGNYNHLNHGYIWRKAYSDHKGHGFTIKDNADQPRDAPRALSEHNLLENMEAVNMSRGAFVARHRGVRNNIFRNGIARGPHTSHSAGCHSTGEQNEVVLIRDGASYNRFENIEAYQTCTVVRFSRTTEDSTLTDLSKEPTGNVVDGIYSEGAAVVVMADTELGAIAVGSNTIKNATFKDSEDLFDIDRPFGDVMFEDCLFENAESWGEGAFITDVVSSQFSNCTFTNVPLPDNW